jgi:hypothetical protein
VAQSPTDSCTCFRNQRDHPDVGGHNEQRARFLQGRPPIRSTEKRSQRPGDYRLVSDDAPNRSWTDSVGKALRRFSASGVALLIVGQPLQKATAL